MTSEMLKELLKLYPKVKIPIESLTEFYVDTLIKHKSFSWLKTKIAEIERFYEVDKLDLTKYKFDISKQILDYFNQDMIYCKGKTYIDALNEAEVPNFIYNKKTFNDYKQDRFYISIDLAEANFNVFKKYSKLWIWSKNYYLVEDALKTWSRMLWEKWEVPPVLNESKSFRQFVLGNTNPKKIAKLQEYEMSKIVTKLLDGVVNESNIVATSSDEIIIELPNNFSKEVINHIISLQFDMPVKYTIFKMNGVKNLGEHVKIKTIYDNDLNEINKELFGVSGTRFFMHFRTLILNEELHENDLLYMNDGFKSKWII